MSVTRSRTRMSPSACSARLAGGDQALLAARDHVIDEAVILRLFGGEDLVPVDVLAHLLDRALAVLGQHLLELGAHAQDLACLDLYVGALAVAALGGRLVNDDAR